MSYCPECGYPDTHDGRHFKGLYDPAKPCSHCGYEARLARGVPSQVLDDLLDELLKDPSQLPRLLAYGAAFLDDWGKCKRGEAPAGMLERCAKIMRTAQKELKRCVQSYPQKKESSS